jgi:hypothetical protein
MIDFDDITQPIDNSEIEKFKDESQFMHSLVELNKQIIKLIYKCCEKFLNENDSPKTLSKEDAVIAGNMARLSKLSKSFLQNICEQKSEICFILDRCIAETCLNIKYILLNGEENVRRNYMKYSLITEKKLHNKVNQNIQKRDGIELPIEERIKTSIENSFDSSDFDMDEVKNSSRWKSVSSRAKAIEDDNFYNVLYGISSHSVHGNWQEILFNHLNENDKGFEIDLDWTHPRPQIIEGVSFQLLEVIKVFCETEICNENKKKKLLVKADDFSTTLSILFMNHERLINRDKE